jgi:hypothetical protein
MDEIILWDEGIGSDQEITVRAEDCSVNEERVSRDGSSAPASPDTPLSLVSGLGGQGLFRMWQPKPKISARFTHLLSSNGRAKEGPAVHYLPHKAGK